MIPVRDNLSLRGAPVVTWTLIALNCFIFLWDRNGHVGGYSIVFADLAMRPKEVVQALTGGADRFPLVTLFTSLFMHANVAHIIGNMIFLLVFGPAIETAMGSMRFSLYYIFWGLVAWAAQIYVMPGSEVPTLGASGAIGGVLGCYLLLFPSSKIELFFPPIDISAWIALTIWFLYQVLVPQEGVANWAHAGGFLAGMLTVLVMGGRSKVLPPEEKASPELAV
jgi:membrane associated rhomboid family serine protease